MDTSTLVADLTAAIEARADALRERQSYAKSTEWSREGDEWPAFELLAHCVSDRKAVAEFAITCQQRDEYAEKIRTGPTSELLRRWDEADQEVAVLRPTIEALAEAYGLIEQEGR